LKLLDLLRMSLGQVVLLGQIVGQIEELRCLTKAVAARRSLGRFFGTSFGQRASTGLHELPGTAANRERALRAANMRYEVWSSGLVLRFTD
jgi:hypothetical protein